MLVIAHAVRDCHRGTGGQLHVADTAHDCRSRGDRCVQDRLARVGMAQVQGAVDPRNHDRHRDLAWLTFALDVLLPDRTDMRCRREGERPRRRAPALRRRPTPACSRRVLGPRTPPTPRARPLRHRRAPTRTPATRPVIPPPTITTGSMESSVVDQTCHGQLAAAYRSCSPEFAHPARPVAPNAVVNMRTG